MGRDCRYYGRRPARSEASLLKIDDLINMAIGTTDKNVVDFKMLQFILYLLAGHVNILEQMVELRLPKSGELSMEDEYYEDTNRGESSKKTPKKEKRERAPGGKRGDDDLRTGRDEDNTDGIDRGRTKESASEVLNKSGGAGIHSFAVFIELDRKGKKQVAGRKFHKEGKAGSQKENDSDSEKRDKGAKREERDDGERRGGKGEIRTTKDRDDADEIDREGKKEGAGRKSDEESEAESQQENDSDSKHWDKGGKRGERDDGERKGGKGEIKTDKNNDDADEIDRGGKKEGAGRESHKKGEAGSQQENINDSKERDKGGKRGEIDDGAKREGKEESRTGQGIDKNKDDTYGTDRERTKTHAGKKSHKTGKAEESESDIKYREKGGKRGERDNVDKKGGKDDKVKSYDESVDGSKVKRTRSLEIQSSGSVVDSFIAQVRRERDSRIGDESESEDKSYRRSNGRYTNTGDDQSGSGRREGEVEKRSEDEATGGGGSRDKDENKERQRKSCDTGIKRIPAKDEDVKEGDDYVDVKHAGKLDSKGRDYGSGRRAGRDESEKGGHDYVDVKYAEKLDKKGRDYGSGRRAGKDEDGDDRRHGGRRAGRDEDEKGGDDRRHGGRRAGRDEDEKSGDDIRHGGRRAGRDEDEKVGDDRRHGGHTGIKYVDQVFPGQPRTRGKSEDVKSTGMSSKDKDGKGKLDGMATDKRGKGGKGYYESDEDEITGDDGTGGKDTKGRGKGKKGDLDQNATTSSKYGKGRGKGKAYLDESDEDGTCGSVGKGRGRETKDKKRGLGRDSEDEYLDRSKSGIGKGKREDIERDESKGRRKVDRDYEDERRGREDKNVGGRGKGKGGEGYDDEDEDDTKGRGGAGARAGKQDAGRGAADKDAAGRKKGTGREASLTSTATDTSVGSRGRKGGAPRVGSIEMVTQDQFHQLEMAVADLQKRAGPMAPPIISNTKLLKDISKGNMSLTDVIATLQLQARLQAAERAINRMADLIALLAAAGALTPEALAQIADIHSEFGGVVKLPVALEAKLPSAVASKGETSQKWKESSTEGRMSIGTSLKWKPSAEAGMFVGRRDFSAEGGMSVDTSMGPSFRSFRSRTGCVSPDEMREALRALREEFMKKANKLGGYANLKANAAEATTKQLAEKVADVEALNDNVTASYNTVSDYTAVFQGFGAGIATQMGSYRQQLGIIQADLRQGLDDRDKSCNSAETREILDAREDMDVLANQRDITHHTHQVLTTKHDNLEAKVKDLMETVELLREMKVDKDEVEDALKDKADSSRIAGLVTHKIFYNVYSATQLRLEMCHDKFRAQEHVWTKAAQDINAVISEKFNASDMEAIRMHMMQDMQQLQLKAKTAAKLLEDPKVAILARRLYKESTAAVKATIEASDATEPPRQAFRPRPAGAEDDVCGRTYREEVSAKPMFKTFEDDRRSHICKRWCGGSHTLVNDTVTREFARPFPTGDIGAVRRYMGQGTDNKIYMMGYHPCECSVERIPGEAEDLCPHYGAGDQGGRPTIVTGQEARRVTIVRDTDLRLMRVETAGRGRGSVRQSFENKAPSKLPDIVVQGRFTVLDEDAGDAPACNAARRSTLAEDRIREQFATVVSNAKDSM